MAMLRHRIAMEAADSCLACGSQASALKSCSRCKKAKYCRCEPVVTSEPPGES
jgi:hypothetical protein